MLSHFSQLTEHLLQKSEDFVGQIGELTSIKSDFEQKLLESNSIIQSLGHEIQSQEVRISNMKAESSQFESEALECKDELR